MIATLISDFGNGDNSVAIAKGTLLHHVPELKILDLSHAVSPHNLVQCSYLLKSAYRSFPKFSVHVSLFDVMHSTPAIVLLAKVENQFIITADNGLLGFTFSEEKPIVWKYEDSESKNYIDWLDKAGKLIADLEQVNYELKLVKLIAYTPQVEVFPLRPLIKQNSLECHVLHVDRYGNVVLNITEKEFEAHKAGRNFSLRIPRQMPITALSDNYAELPNGMEFCMFNSAGYLEIGIKNSSASQLLGLKAFVKDQMIYNTITIEFN